MESSIDIKGETGSLPMAEVTPKPVTLVKASVTVISDRDRVTEINRMELDRILFWDV